MSALLRSTLALSLLIALLFAASCSKKTEAEADPSQLPGNGVQPEPADSLQITLTGADSVSVLALLEAAHKVDVHESAMGAFVKGIDSIENGGGYFWLYTVNDSTGKVAADKYITSDSDVVVWHYRKIGQ